MSARQKLKAVTLSFWLCGPAVAVPCTNSVFQWGRFEAAVINTNIHTDPYRDVTLNVTYTRPDASTVSFWGFYDGNNTWRVRFMPDQRWPTRVTTATPKCAPAWSRTSR